MQRDFVVKNYDLKLYLRKDGCHFWISCKTKFILTNNIIKHTIK